MNAIPTVVWKKDAAILIDQTRLPEKYTTLTIRTPRAMWDAIQRLVVRGAPAIGVAAAYGVVLGIQKSKASSAVVLNREVQKVAAYLATSRPTAVNLFWALDRMKAVSVAAVADGMSVADMKARLCEEAKAIHEEDARLCANIGTHGAKLVKKGTRILTHCNAGALATGGEGTALAVIYEAHRKRKVQMVYADETRPLLQGSRLTAWELSHAQVPVTVICDNMAAQLMGAGAIDFVVVGADRIAANGDAANKIGTYGVAVLARAHGIPFYVAAPSSTFDMTLKTGAGIPIEQRKADEVNNGFGQRTAPKGVAVYNPAFDVTPARLITGIITEHGVIEKPSTAKVTRMIGKA